MQQFNSITIEQYNNKKGLTLIELLIAICIFALIIIGFSSIDTFSRYHVITSDRRAKLQNDASYVLGHMAKNLTGTGTSGGAVGDANNYPVQPTNISGNNGITFRVDSNNNGKLDGSDKQIAYTYSAANYQIWYYSNYTDYPDSYEVLTQQNPVTGYSHIRPNFSSDISQPTYRSYSSANNYIEVQIGACWTPSSDATCGTADNPSLSMKNRIYMPAVSTH